MSEQLPGNSGQFEKEGDSHLFPNALTHPTMREAGLSRKGEEG